VQHLPFADNILVLEDGHLVTQGNLQSLLSGTTDVYRFVNAGQHQTEGISDVVAVITASVGDAGLSQKEGLSAERDTQDKDHADNQKTKKEESQDEDDEQAGVLGSRGWGPYKFFLEACGWSRLSIAAICLVAYTLMEIGLQACDHTSFRILQS
jgi:ATP-binding cassette, subfamily C (CFTR/MRP), member 1